jgi:hypothetical protein
VARRKPRRNSALEPGLSGGDELAHVKLARNAGHRTRNELPWRSSRSLTDVDRDEMRAGVEQIVEYLGALLIGALTLRYGPPLRRPLLMA